ncbi:hypothetical protein V8E54_006038 [Elaphomyces granulatus]
MDNPLFFENDPPVVSMEDSMDWTPTPNTTYVNQPSSLPRAQTMDSTSTAAPESSSNIENDHNIFSSEDKKEQKNDYNDSRRGRIRFKSSNPDRNSHDEHHHRRHRRHHHGHHHSRTNRKPSLSPDTAFRESLFDALGDDEGAAFWESVYGQPIHTYAVPSIPKGPKGKLERMTDEEYVAYVRSQMWKRTHRGKIEEQERLRKEREEEKKRTRKSRKQEEDRLRFERAIEKSLQRGRERQKRAKAWKAIWEEYQRSWEELNDLVLTTEAGGTASGSSTNVGGKTQEMRFRNHIFWPVQSGKRQDISHDGVEEFMRHAPPIVASSSDEGNTSNFVAILKTERVRWHPDKIQQRYGVLGIDEPVTRGVTEVFQILDKLWADQRERQQNH